MAKKSGNKKTSRVTPHVPRAGYKASGSRYGKGGKLTNKQKTV